MVMLDAEQEANELPITSMRRSSSILSMLLIRNLRQIATPRGRTGVRGRAMRDLDIIDERRAS
jgi:hypothetical protein